MYFADVKLLEIKLNPPKIMAGEGLYRKAGRASNRRHNNPGLFFVSFEK